MCSPTTGIVTWSPNQVVDSNRQSACKPFHPFNSLPQWEQELLNRDTNGAVLGEGRGPTVSVYDSTCVTCVYEHMCVESKCAHVCVRVRVCPEHVFRRRGPTFPPQGLSNHGGHFSQLSSERRPGWRGTPIWCGLAFLGLAMSCWRVGTISVPSPLVTWVMTLNSLWK